MKDYEDEKDIDNIPIARLIDEWLVLDGLLNWDSRDELPFSKEEIETKLKEYGLEHKPEHKNDDRPWKNSNTLDPHNIIIQLDGGLITSVEGADGPVLVMNYDISEIEYDELEIDTDGRPYYLSEE